VASLKTSRERSVANPVAFRALFLAALPDTSKDQVLRPRGGVVTQRSAKPFTPVQFRAWPPALSPNHPPARQPKVNLPRVLLVIVGWITVSSCVVANTTDRL